MLHSDMVLATFHLFSMRRTPWALVGFVLGAAILSRSLMFVWMMWRRRD